MAALLSNWVVLGLLSAVFTALVIVAGALLVAR